MHRTIFAVLIFPTVFIMMVLNTEDVDASGLSQTFMHDDTAAADQFEFNHAFTTTRPSSDDDHPTVVIAVIIENHAISLPYHFFYLQRLEFPQSRISVWIYCNNPSSEDGAGDIAREWKRRMGDDYQDIHVNCDNENNENKENKENIENNENNENNANTENNGNNENTETNDNNDNNENNEKDEQKERSDPVLLRQSIIKEAMAVGKDYLLLVDADTILEEPRMLLELISGRFTISAPLLVDPGDRFLHHKSNFAVDKNNSVRWVRGAVLIALHKQEAARVNFELSYDGVGVDIIPHTDGPGIRVCMKKNFGWLPLLVTNDWGKDFHSIILENQPPFLYFLYMDQLVRYPEPTTQGFDEVYVINLERRPDRRRTMQRWMRMKGLKGRFTQAVDGWTLTESKLQELGVTTAEKSNNDDGWIGCFLSHYNVWKDAYERNYSQVMLLEDDFRPRRHFNEHLQEILQEAETIPGGWDIIYLFRVPVDAVPPEFPPQPEDTVFNSQGEPYVTNYLVKPRYSWSTLGYMVSASGLEKLMSGEPLKNVCSVDVWLMLHLGVPTDQPQEITDLFSSRPRLRAFGTWGRIGTPDKTWHAEGHVSDIAFNFTNETVKAAKTAFTPRLATN